MLWNWIAYHARQKPSARAVILSGQAVTYGKFACDIARATDDLRARLPASTSLVAVGVRQSYLHWLALAALSRLRIATVSVVEVGEVAAAQPDLLIADGGFGPVGMPVIEADAAWSRGGADPAAWTVRDRDDDFAMRMIVSSGTTGTPKRVLLSAAQLAQRTFQNIVCYAIAAQSRTNVQMGAGTTGGFTVPLATWCVGGAAVLAAEPMFNELVPAAAKPDLVLLSPANLEVLLAKATAEAEAFPTTRFLIGGSPVPQATMQRARARLSRHTGVVYGSTEAGMIAIDAEARTPFVPQAAGHVTPLTEVEIVDDADVVQPALTQGHVRIRSLGLVDGYLDDPETTREMFRDGWFYPGDLGVFRPDGLLIITGRSADTFNFGGVKISPITLEEAALAVPGVVDAGACAVNDRAGQLAVVAVAVTEGYAPAALAEALQARFGKFRIAIAEVAEIPRNRMGKIVRHALADAIIRQRASMG